MNGSCGAVPAVLAAALLAGVAQLAAGCGGSPAAPTVANLAPTTATTTPSSGGGPSGAGILAQQEGYARCMRSHGVPDFPDPTPDSRGGGGFDITASPRSDLNQNLPKYQAADRACKALLPGGSRTPAQLAQAVAAGVKLADCMRSHGVPTFPDPDSQDDFNLNAVSQNSPLFQAAFKTCGGLAGARGASFSSSSSAGRGGPAGAAR